MLFYHNDKKLTYTSTTFAILAISAIQYSLAEEDSSHLLRFAKSSGSDDHLLRYAKSADLEHMLRYARSGTDKADQNMMLRFARNPDEHLLRFAKRSPGMDDDHMLRYMRRNEDMDDHLLRFGKRQLARSNLMDRFARSMNDHMLRLSRADDGHLLRFNRRRRWSGSLREVTHFYTVLRKYYCVKMCD